MPFGTFRVAGAGLFPLILGVFLMILSGVFVLNIFLQRKKEPGKKGLHAQIPGSAWNLILFLGTMARASPVFNFRHLSALKALEALSFGYASAALYSSVSRWEIF
jgi:hypothetical protein